VTAPAWVRPTTRLVAWPALALPLAVAAGMGALSDFGGRPTTGTLALAGVGAAAGAVPSCLDDPAHQLVAALPVSRRRRVAQRLVLAVPPVLVAWLVITARWIPLPGSSSDHAAPLLALAAIGVATAVIAQRRRPDLAATVGVAAPLVIVATQIAFGGQDPPAPLRAWLDHPWPTAAVATAAAIAALADPVRHRLPHGTRG
jgi:hypothetical protein